MSTSAELPELPAIAPMLATAAKVADLGSPERWAYEVKWDGYRAVAAVVGAGAAGTRAGAAGALRLRSRSGLDLAAAYPELGELTTALAGHAAVLDGEIVALDADGRSDFGRLQHRGDATAGVRAHYMAFDVLHLDGVSLLAEPYTRRRELLQALLTEGRHVHVPTTFGSDLDVALDVSRSLRLEGIVAKRLDGPYLPGRRARTWLKIKHVRMQEVVVVGWTPGSGRRAGTLGSLLLAVPGGAPGTAPRPDATPGAGQWSYVGKVGTGFTDRDLDEIRSVLAGRERATPVVRDVPRVDAKAAHWVEPDLVGEVTFAEWTDTGRLRHPAWRGWRPDKLPGDVQREP